MKISYLLSANVSSLCSLLFMFSVLAFDGDFIEPKYGESKNTLSGSQIRSKA